MDPEQIKELAAKLGLGDNATPEMLFGALMMKLGGDAKPADPPKSDANPPDPNQPPAGPDPTKKNEENGAPVTQQFSEEIKNSPLVKKLTEALETQSKKFAEMELASNIKRLNEAAEKGGHIIAQPLEAAITKLLSESTSDTYTETLVKTFSDMLSEVGPETGEKGGQHKQLTDQDTSSGKKFNDAVKARMLSDRIGYAEAAVLVASEDNDSYEAHRNESYIKDGE